MIKRLIERFLDWVFGVDKATRAEIDSPYATGFCVDNAAPGNKAAGHDRDYHDPPPPEFTGIMSRKRARLILKNSRKWRDAGITLTEEQALLTRTAEWMMRHTDRQILRRDGK